MSDPAEIEKAIEQVSKRDLNDIKFAQAQVRNFAHKQRDTVKDLEVETLTGYYRRRFVTARRLAGAAPPS